MAAAAVIGVISAGSATAQADSCTETAALADAIYAAWNCDVWGDILAICSLPAALNSCCDNTSGETEQESCVCTTYSNANQTPLNNKGFSAPSFCSG